MMTTYPDSSTTQAGTTTAFIIDSNRDYAQVIRENDGAEVLDSSFNLLDDTIEVFYEDPDHENTEPVIVTNMSRFLPLARHKGDYLVVDLLSENGEEIHEIMFGYSACLYAYSVKQHIDYLIDGFANGNVTIDEDNEMYFPALWCHRST